jgi:hypothetical protein
MTKKHYLKHKYIPKEGEIFRAFEVLKFTNRPDGTQNIYSRQMLGCQLFECRELHGNYLIAKEKTGQTKYLRKFDFHHFIFKKAKNGSNQ